MTEDNTREPVERHLTPYEEIRGALQWLVDDMSDAGEDANPETGQVYDSVQHARDVLAKSWGSQTPQLEVAISELAYNLQVALDHWDHEWSPNPLDAYKRAKAAMESFGESGIARRELELRVLQQANRDLVTALQATIPTAELTLEDSEYVQGVLQRYGAPSPVPLPDPLAELQTANHFLAGNLQIALNEWKLRMDYGPGRLEGQPGDSTERRLYDAALDALNKYRTREGGE